MTRDFSTKSPGALRRGFHRLFRHFVRPYPDNAQHLGFKTGELWIDGREIYRKIVVISSMPADGVELATAHNIPSIGKVIQISGLVRDGAEVMFVPSTTTLVKVDVTNLTVRGTTASAGLPAEFYIDYVLPA